MELVLLQFDNTLKMDIIIRDDLQCSNFSRAEHNTDSLHVIEYLEMFKVRVNLKYELIKDGEISCDIVEDDLCITIDNQVDIDNDEHQFKEFSSKLQPSMRYAFTYYFPENGGCSFEIMHELNKGGIKIGILLL